MWIVTRVLPLIRQAIPDARVRLVGGGAVTVFNDKEADDEKIDKIIEIGDFISGR